MKAHTLILGLAFALILAGCATATSVTGRDFDSTNVSKIKKGETTVAQLQNWLGSPYSKNVNSDGTEQWLWMYAQTTAHAQSYVVSMNVKSETTGKRLLVDVKNGVVENFSFTDGPFTPNLR